MLLVFANMLYFQRPCFPQSNRPPSTFAWIRRCIAKIRKNNNSHETNVRKYFPRYFHRQPTVRSEFLSNDVDTVLEEDGLFADRKQLTLLNSATLSHRPLWNILWSFLAFLAGEDSLPRVFFAFPLSPSLSLFLPRAYFKYVHTWYT